MSETEHNKGKLKPAGMSGGVEATAKRICENLGFALSEYNDTYLEQLEDDGYRSWILIGDIIYKVENESVDAEGDIMNAKILDDGTIEYEVRYYNGGCSFGEAIQTAVDKQ